VEPGTAFAVGWDGSTLYLVTDWHVIEDLDAQGHARSVTLSFDPTVCGAAHPDQPGTVLHVDRKLDLAVLTVKSPDCREPLGKGVIRPLEVSRLVSAADRAGLEGKALTVIGRNAEDAKVTLRNLWVLASDRERITVQSSDIQGGFSGSPAFHDGELVGMAFLASKTEARLIPFIDIKNRLEAPDWKVPTDLVGGVTALVVSPYNATVWLDEIKQDVRADGNYYIRPATYRTLKLTRGDDDPVQKRNVPLFAKCISVKGHLVDWKDKAFYYGRIPAFVLSAGTLIAGAVLAGQAKGEEKNFYRTPTPDLRLDALRDTKWANRLLYAGGAGLVLVGVGQVILHPAPGSTMDDPAPCH
jgi:hypothetical protein